VIHALPFILLYLALGTGWMVTLADVGYRNRWEALAVVLLWPIVLLAIWWSMIISDWSDR
jgi:hypothetical protein